MAERPPSPQSFRYIHCDIPAGMTIAQFRAQRVSSPVPRVGASRSAGGGVSRIVAVVVRRCRGRRP